MTYNNNLIDLNTDVNDNKDGMETRSKAAIEQNSRDDVTDNLEDHLKYVNSIGRSKSVRRPPPSKDLDLEFEDAMQKVSKRFSKSLDQSVKGFHDLKRNFSTIKSKANQNINSRSAVAACPKVTPFWKYHVLKFGKDLYLTTNPDMKHVYCRQAPSYYVEVEESSSGYKLILKNPCTLNVLMIIEKNNGSFSYRISKDVYLNDGILTNYEDAAVFKGVSFTQPISRKYFPIESLRNQFPYYFKNFEITDSLRRTWNIGSIPRIRLSRLNKIKENEYKMIGKRNIYFHQNYTTNDPAKYKEKDPRRVYHQDEDVKFPPVLSCFRPFKRKNILKDMKKLKNNYEENPYVNVNDDNEDTDEKYYYGSDGLYYLSNTEDDTPNENKLGWITVYEDQEVFSGVDNRGMFNLVLGMTLAIGYDSCIEI
ncbi:unnamed protein product [Candida verbasci]|uniref:Uncharacterized protein n=1 Tax=Candida verbasci TaxID=1227364 RepID=A0A9W4XA71_9ASCO|nr:unnamed protein product [Candida verbasci]